MLKFCIMYFIFCIMYKVFISQQRLILMEMSLFCCPLNYSLILHSALLTAPLRAEWSVHGCCHAFRLNQMFRCMGFNITNPLKGCLLFTHQTSCLVISSYRTDSTREKVFAHKTQSKKFNKSKYTIPLISVTWSINYKSQFHHGSPHSNVCNVLRMCSCYIYIRIFFFTGFYKYGIAGILNVLTQMCRCPQSMEPVGYFHRSV